MGCGGEEFILSVEIDECKYLVKNIYSNKKEYELYKAFYISPDLKIFDFDGENWNYNKNGSYYVNSDELWKTFSCSNDLFSEYAASYYECNVAVVSRLERVYVPSSVETGSNLETGRFAVVFREMNSFEDGMIFSFRISSVFNKLEKEICKKYGFKEFSFGLSQKILENSKSSEEYKKASREYLCLLNNTLLNNIECSGKKIIWKGKNYWSCCEGLKSYLDYLKLEKYPLLVSKIELVNEKYKYFERIEISPEEGKKLAEASKKYLTNCAEYFILNKDGSRKIFSNKLLESVQDKWFLENENSLQDFWPENNFSFYGNPMPYSKCGIDTPRSFCKKIILQKEYLVSPDKKSSVKNSVYSKYTFLPGIQSENLISAGTDSFGMFTGCVYMSGLENFFYSANNTQPGENLKKYSKNINKLKNENRFINTNKYSPDSKFYEEDFELFSYFLTDFSEIRPGDILTCNTSRNKNIFIVTEASSSKNMNGIKGVYIQNFDGGTAVECKWSELENKEYWCPRRLLKLSLKTYVTNKKTDILDENPYSGRLELFDMNEETQNSNENWPWIPNTGEWLEISRFQIQLYNKAGLLLENNKTRFETEFFLEDRNFDKNKGELKNKDIYSNVINNNPDGKFQIALSSKDNKIEAGVVSKSSASQKDYNRVEVKNKIYISGGGKFYSVKNNQMFSIFIRPLNSASAFAGDDVFLKIRIKTDYGNCIICDNVKYMAVYDKKLLWRANLYLNEKENYDVDWNDIHPWNSPPSENCSFQFRNNLWWSKDWGYNEWNRKYDGTQNVNIISELNTGNGGQTVVFQEFTPVRTIADNKTLPTDKNKINRTIAYSYPQRNKDVDSGMSGSMDSPFDFLWKLNHQYEYRKQFSGENKNVMWNTKENRWSNYKKSEEEKNISQSFIPELGLFYFGYNTTEKNYLEKELTDIVTENNYEAGTDCIGFVQRCASYAGNKYKWKDLPKGIMENGTSVYTEVLDQYNYSNSRLYPYNAQEQSQRNESSVYAVDIISGTLDEKKNPEQLSLENIRNIVPGDIFVKDSVSDKDSYLNNHIGIIAFVPPDSFCLSDDELLDSIIIIESTFGNILQSVVKCFSLKDYAYSKNLKNVKVYDDVELASGTIDMLVESWAVRRLK